MKKSAATLTKFLFLFLALSVNASEDWLQFHQSFNKSLQVTVVYPKDLAPSVLELRLKIEQALGLAQARMGIRFRDDFELLIDKRPDFHNGLTTVIPSNRIVVHSEAPDLESSIGLYEDYLLETLIHEFSHLLVMQTREGVFKGLSAIFGTTARPLGAWPRWMHEGLAVWTESVVWGRPRSGYIDLDVRRYADQRKRTGVDPLSSSDLDGSRRLELDGSRRLEDVGPGDLPYHFGYGLWALLIPALEESGGLNEFVREAAKGPGSSFRIQVREFLKRQKSPQVLDLDILLERQKAQWNAVSTERLKGPEKEIAKSRNVDGPYLANLPKSSSSEGKSISWIEWTKAGKPPTLKSQLTKEGLTIQTAWKYRNSVPIQNYALNENLWLVLYRQNPGIAGGRFYNPSFPSRKFVALFDGQGELLCRVVLPGRLREIHYSMGFLSWIRVATDGVYFAQSAPLVNDCGQGNIKPIAQGARPFERLSGIYFDGVLSLLSRHSNRLEVLEVNGSALQNEAPLSMAVPAGDGFLAHEFSKNYWGPVLISGRGRGRASYRLPAWPTGSFRAVPGFGEKTFWVKESTWEHDRIVELSLDQLLKNVPPGTMETTSVSVPAPEVLPAIVEMPYASLNSFWPQFWLPSMLVVAGGVAVQGETFTSDVTDTWQGGLIAGYDSSQKRPYTKFRLKKNDLSWGPFYSASGLSYYLPVLIGTPSGSVVQNRWGASLRLATSRTMPLSSRLDLFPEIGFQQAAAQGTLQGYNFGLVGLGAVLSSQRGQKSNSANFRLPRAMSGWVADSKFRFLRGAEIYGGVAGHQALGSSALYGGLEFGHTQSSNYPASYFQFGGPYLFSTELPNFLTRGFRPNLGLAKSIARLETQWGFPITSLNRGLSWNRFRLSNLDASIIFETVTFSSFNEASRFRLGRQYFTSVGAQTELSGVSLNYVDYRLGTGLFKGFGASGGTRFLLYLRSSLDI